MTAWLGPAISGVGSFLSSIVGGIFSRKESKKQRAWLAHMDATKIQRLAADAKAAGIHPLAAMGTASFNAPTGGFGGGAGVAEGLSAMFQGFGEGISAADKAGRYDQERQEDLARSSISERRNAMLQSAQLRKIDAEVRLIEAEARRITDADAARRVAIGGHPPVRVDAPYETVPLSVKVKHRDGTVLHDATPEGMPGPEEMVAHWMRRTLVDKERREAEQRARDRILRKFGMHKRGRIPGYRRDPGDYSRGIRRKDDRGPRGRRNWNRKD